MARLAIIAAAIAALSCVGIAAAINARADAEAMMPRIDATPQRAKEQDVFQHQACADCPVMTVHFVPPKP